MTGDRQDPNDDAWPADRRLVVMLSYRGANLLDISGPVQAFETAARQAVASGEWAAAPYRTVVASETGGPVLTGAGVAIDTVPLAALDGRDIDTLIAPGGSPDGQPVAEPALVRWIAGRAAAARRVCSVCTGTFLLAEAGLLQGLRVTTHWRWAQRLQAMYPGLLVDAEPIFIRQGRIWTSAGVTAGIDLALALVEADLGHRTALAAARDMVMFIKRPGGQSQFSVPLLAQHGAGQAQFAELHAWMVAHLHEDLRVERLAEQAGMAPRTFARAYAAAVGRTPAKTVECMRFEAACRALEASPAPLKRIAADTGHGSEQNLRRLFLRRLRVTPQQYRARFAPNHPMPA
ncbi:GlxA family transcriptional regulator [Bordetella genomosp. 11]|uniref:AraC family transcriptional regulator n=1 Tax=Bordetella genomosp. 11 TaxID=1416808 RepID=A0A261UXJ7_9BORD|nr:DJ-1/PfpI family protein [Bordetella genomosp. 11]OZI66385.1 AraC family transcriptional regulator [Bordetella genomosp. 11]